MQAQNTIDPDLDQHIEAAARLIRNGQLVAFPTETVYGLGADATNGEAVARIFEAKQRPSFNPLIVHVLNRETATQFVRFNADADKLAHTFWPGGLTLVLPAVPNSNIASLVSAGLDTIAIRIPAHPVARALLKAANRPIAAPSANRSGRVSPTHANHVVDEFDSSAPMILDGGACDSGLESTIIDLSGAKPILLRPGTVTREEIQTALGKPLGEASSDNPKQPVAPGQLQSHYAPNATVRLNATGAEQGEALIGFGPGMPEKTGPAVNLSTTGDLREAAAHLFGALRSLDQPDITTIAVMPIPNTGIGEAINDRLRRAAAPRT